MAGLSHQWLIDSQDFGPPANWGEFEIEGIFSQEHEDSIVPENQPNLSVDRLLFTGAAAAYISARHKNGLTGGRGAFQGSTISWTISDKTGAYKAFDGYIDYSDGYREFDFKAPKRTNPNQVSVKIVDTYGLNSLLNQVDGVTMDLIRDNFGESDWTNIDFVVIKKYDFLEYVTLFISLYIFIKEVKDASIELGKAISDAFGGVTGPFVSALKIALQLVYIAFLYIQIINLGREILALLYSKKRTHKGVSLRKILVKGFEKLGYTFVSPITQLDKYTILPTLPTKKSNFKDELFNKVRVTDSGLPSINDWGFLFSENLTTCKRLFNARLAVVNNGGVKEVHMRTDGDDWWFKQSNLTLLNDVLVDEVGYNQDELFRDVYLKFATDSTDEWTKEELKGTSFETITSSSPRPDNGGIPLEKTLNEVFIPYALGVRKANLTGLEKLLLTVLGAVEDVANVFGGNVNLTQNIRNRPNFLKLSGYEIAIPKLLYMDTNGIPANHRDLLGAKFLAQTFHRTKSFVNASDSQPYNNQYQTFGDVTIKFDLQKFLQLRQNAYFITDEGESGKIDSFKWNPSKDTGTFSGRFRFVYDKSLTETTHELKNDEE